MPLSKKEKTAIGDALDIIATRDVSWTWDANWKAGHNSNTSQLGGYKPGSRQDSKDPKLYWVGIFTSKNKSIEPPPLITASFAAVPTTAQAVAALRTALENA
ncbi:hypothetical protein MD484_g4150, partial [Candolleomyces efflorescens]